MSKKQTKVCRECLEEPPILNGLCYNCIEEDVHRPEKMKSAKKRQTKHEDSID